MKTSVYNIEFITPCLCAGADPSRAEIRAPSIRGKLRWWFRVLGGSPEDEAQVFGATRGNQSRSSAILIRVSDIAVSNWSPPAFAAMSDEGYLLYFAKVSGKKPGNQEGPRWKPEGGIAEGSGFKLTVMQTRPLSEVLQRRFDQTLRCFLLLGGLGLRSTRGLGAFECAEYSATRENMNALAAEIRAECPNLKIFTTTHTVEFGKPILRAMGAQLRGLRKDGYSAGKNGNNPTPLGTSNPRQASAVYLRPIRIEGKAQLVVFEAPADRVLAPNSRKGAPRLGRGVPIPVSENHRQSHRRR